MHTIGHSPLLFGHFAAVLAMNSELTLFDKFSDCANTAYIS